MKIFWPVSSPAVAVALGARLEPAGVGAGARLGQRVAAELLAGGEAGEEARRLLVGAPAWRPSCRTRPFETETIPRTFESARPISSTTSAYETMSSPIPPCSSGSAAARKPSSASFPTIAAVDRLGAVPLGRVRRDLGVAERARGLRGSAPARRRA